MCNIVDDVQESIIGLRRKKRIIKRLNRKPLIESILKTISMMEEQEALYVKHGLTAPPGHLETLKSFRKSLDILRKI